MTTKKTIYIIRHGETDYNKNGIIQGSGIDSSLNETGRKQAEQFYHAYRHLRFDKIYTSELKRTQESVDGFTDAGYRPIALSEFNEINWGKFEGLKTTPESRLEYQRIVIDWQAGLLDRCVEGGETPNQMQRRQKKGLEKLLQKENERQILICMHGRAMRSFICLLTGTPLDRMDEYKHSNLCLYKFEQKGELFEVKERNSTTHLWI